MAALSYTAARSNLAKTMEKVCDDRNNYQTKCRICRKKLSLLIWVLFLIACDDNPSNSAIDTFSEDITFTISHVVCKGDLNNNTDSLILYVPERKAYIGQITDDYNKKWYFPYDNVFKVNNDNYTITHLILRVKTINTEHLKNLIININPKYTSQSEFLISQFQDTNDISNNRLDDDGDFLRDEEDEDSLFTYIIPFELELNYNEEWLYLKLGNGEKYTESKKIHFDMDHRFATIYECDSIGNPSGTWLGFPSTSISWPYDSIRTYFLRSHYQEIIPEELRISFKKKNDTTQQCDLEYVQGIPGENQFSIFADSSDSYIFKINVNSKYLCSNDSTLLLGDYVCVRETRTFFHWKYHKQEDVFEIIN